MVQHEADSETKRIFLNEVQNGINFFLTKIKTLGFFSLKAYHSNYPIMIFPGATFHTVTQQEELKGDTDFRIPSGANRNGI